MLHKSSGTSVPLSNDSPQDLPHEERYVCQFRDVGKDYYKSDCSMPTYGQAVRYCTRVITTLKDVVEARIYLEGEPHKILWSLRDGEDFLTVDFGTPNYSAQNPTPNGKIPISYIHVWFGQGKPLVEFVRGQKTKQFRPSPASMNRLETALLFCNIHTTPYNNGWSCTVKAVYPSPAREEAAEPDQEADSYCGQCTQCDSTNIHIVEDFDEGEQVNKLYCECLDCWNAWDYPREGKAYYA